MSCKDKKQVGDRTSWNYSAGFKSVVEQIPLGLNSRTTPRITSSMISKLESAEITWTQLLVLVLRSVLEVLWFVEVAIVTSMVRAFIDFPKGSFLVVEALLTESSTVTRASLFWAGRLDNDAIWYTVPEILTYWTTDRMVDEQYE